jgi:hypothetical protein
MTNAAPIKWIVTSSGDHRELILADSPGEARRIFEEMHAEPPLAVRLHSGFPRLYAFDLVFDETVFRRDLFPSPNSDGWVEIRNQEQLDRYLRRVPVGIEFVPPLRRTPTCHGQWKSPELQESRERFAAAKLEALTRDRLAGLSCE